MSNIGIFNLDSMEYCYNVDIYKSISYLEYNVMYIYKSEGEN